VLTNKRTDFFAREESRNRRSSFVSRRTVPQRGTPQDDSFAATRLYSEWRLTLEFWGLARGPTAPTSIGLKPILRAGDPNFQRKISAFGIHKERISNERMPILAELLPAD